MGLDFSVGTASAAFIEPFAAEVTRALRTQLGVSLPEDAPGNEAYYSEEVGWSWWGMLQQRAAAVLGENGAQHLSAVEAWQGVFLPAPISPTVVRIEGLAAPLQCASLCELLRELEAFAEALSLPVEEDGIRGLEEKYMMDDALVDADEDVQTYIQLMLAAKNAVSRSLPLWVVK